MKLVIKFSKLELEYQQYDISILRFNINETIDRLKVHELLKLYQVGAVPAVFFIKNGLVLEKIINPSRSEFLKIISNRF